MMLVEAKGYAVGDVVSIRLVSGEEIIGTLKNETAISVTLTRPLTVVMQATGRGEVGLSFGPFMASGPEMVESVTFQTNAMICMPIRSRKDVADGYKKTVSPIMTPNTGLVI
jgi:hypothetical protein